MTLTEQIITIAMCVLGTMATRFLPFLIFSEKRPTPRYVQYLGRALPAAIFGMLVVYCLRNTDPLGPNHALPELLAGAAVVGLQCWRKNTLLSIAAGTVFYMILIQRIFV